MADIVEDYIPSMINIQKKSTDDFIALIDEFKTLGEKITSQGYEIQREIDGATNILAPYNKQHGHFASACEQFRGVNEMVLQQARKLEVVVNTNAQQPQTNPSQTEITTADIVEDYIPFMINFQKKSTDDFIALIDEFKTLREKITSEGYEIQREIDDATNILAPHNEQHRHFASACEQFRGVNEMVLQQARELEVTVNTNEQQHKKSPWGKKWLHPRSWLNFFKKRKPE